MTGHLTDAHNACNDIAPAFADYTDNVLFGDVWKRPGLVPRDHSLTTIARKAFADAGK